MSECRVRASVCVCGATSKHWCMNNACAVCVCVWVQINVKECVCSHTYVHGLRVWM